MGLGEADPLPLKDTFEMDGSAVQKGKDEIEGEFPLTEGTRCGLAQAASPAPSARSSAAFPFCHPYTPSLVGRRTFFGHVFNCPKRSYLKANLDLGLPRIHTQSRTSPDMSSAGEPGVWQPASKE